MLNNKFMFIDGMPVELTGKEKNILEVIRKADVNLPTFCYHSDLSIYGACRMCMVEMEKGELEAACSAQPRHGMSIRTNTEKLRKYRRMILELILANHCRDCTTCQSNQNCKLQDLARRLQIDDVRFPNVATEPIRDRSSLCITKDISKCIKCGDCVRVCNEIQNVGAIDFAHRSSKMKISTAFDVPLAESECVGCGQCSAVCPTGAMVVKDDAPKLWKDLADHNTRVIAQIAPAVRVAIGNELGFSENGENLMGKIVAALHRMGFSEVFDSSTTADLTVLEESAELVEHIKAGNKLPLFSSCCPGWVNLCETKYPELLPHVSTCKSPMQMFGAIIKEYYKDSPKKVVHVAVMPCTAKKFEAGRTEHTVDGKRIVDYVITTQEMISMIRESGIIFKDLEDEAVDAPFGVATGAGVIFGVTGGVTEAVLRHITTDKTTGALRTIAATSGARGREGIKELSIPYGDIEVKIAVVSGLGNAAKIIERIKAGEHFDFVEVMACPNGCVNGAGQPYLKSRDIKVRTDGLYRSDKAMSMKRSEENTLISNLYDGVLKGKVHKLLHTHYKPREIK